MSINVNDIIKEFSDALKARGLILEDLPKMDGEWHRVRTIEDKRYQLSGAYRGFLDGKPAGSIHNWKRKLKDNWVTGQNIISTDFAALQQHSIEQKNQRLAERFQMHELRASTSEQIWQQCSAAPASHAYLKRKQVDCVGLRVIPDQLVSNEVLVARNWQQARNLRQQNPDKLIFTAGDLLMPLRDISGKIWSLQTISAVGMKGYLKQGKKLENFHVLGQLENGKPIIIGEGYATMATLHDVSKQVACLAVCDISNLPHVTRLIRQHFPDSKLYLGADNDWLQYQKNPKLGNPGLDTAKECAAENSAFVLVPSFTQDQPGSDWNDLYVMAGRAAVKQQLLEQLAQAKEYFNQVEKPASTSTMLVDNNNEALKKSLNPAV